MTKQQQKEFLNKPFEGNNIMRLAQEILSGPATYRHQITPAVRNLAKFKNAKDMTLGQIIEALRMISEKEF